MCGRYYIAEEDPEVMLAEYVAAAQRRADVLNVPLVARGEVRPTNVAPVIAPNAKNRQPDVFPMKWGFIHPSRGMLVFNTRSETAAEKPFFATSIDDRRCLIPASCYYEWQKADGRKIKYAIRPKDELLYMAGLYIRSSKERIPSFSILTMDAADSIKSIHARMPVMISQSKIADWLSCESFFKGFWGDMILEYECQVAAKR